MENVVRQYVESYGNSADDESVAALVCQLMNNGFGAQWVPDGVNEKPKLLIGGFFPLWKYGVWKQPNLVPGGSN